MAWDCGGGRDATCARSGDPVTSSSARAAQAIETFTLLCSRFSVRVQVRFVFRFGSCSGSVRVQLRLGVFRRACCARPSLPPATYHLPPTTYHLPPTTYRHRRMHSQFSLVRVMI